MRASLAPVEAGAGKAAALGTQRGDIDAPVGQRLLAVAPSS
jgi:hypothetical protein